MIVAKFIAQFFADRGIKHAFTISGAGNLRILEAIQNRGATKLICCHHEQAAAQAAISYYRLSGSVSPVLVTCGAGASNVVTGIVSAWMDSIPMIVIAGQESRRNDSLRAYGVQGLDLCSMTQDVTRFRTIITKSYRGLQMDFADWYRQTGAPAFDNGDGHGEWKISERPGPIVIEVPIDIQGMQC